jgi:hypothetical protein
VLRKVATTALRGSLGFAAAAADHRLETLSKARLDACAARSSFEANCL